MKAFPRSAFTPDEPNHKNYAEAGFANTKEDGMDLRDYFAAKAMQALLNGMTRQNDMPETNREDINLAKVSYNLADAMLKVRGK